MICALHLPKTASFLCCTLLIPVTAFADSEWRVYDVRDLIEVLPAPVNAGEAAGVVSGAVLDSPPTALREEQKNAVDELVRELANRIGMGVDSLLPGIYGIEAEEAAHAQLRNLLTQIRQLYQERYTVDITTYVVESANAPAIGDEMPAGSIGTRQSLVATRRAPVEVRAQSHRAYVSEVQPVVASGATGYAPVVRYANEGLLLRLVVGAGEEDAEHTSIAVSGHVRQVTLDKQSYSIYAVDTGLRVDLPAKHERSVQSSLRVPFGSARVLAVAQGFDHGHVIAIAGAVRKLADKP